MAFHVGCPITCKKICFCKLGLPLLQTDKSRSLFLDEVVRISDFLKDPFDSRVSGKTTVQVYVPRVEKPPEVAPAVVDGDGGEEALLLLSSQTKRIALQKKAAAASLVAEDMAKKFESGQSVIQMQTQAVSGEVVVGEEHGQLTENVMCRMCFHGETVGSQRARKMLSCKDCGKKYHRNCIKNWSHHRDLFHWSLWTCPSCRICEICRRTGDPNKFMFCKRCDGAYHCYCQQPPHKNVSSGPYLCPKHTRCHSCGSKVPGNGLSLRWFLGYTCCDACGRLFVKGNYCPVCLKVYRDSESTPMVCCDICQRWVHCQCDEISDEKYLQFQANNNLQYVCTACRGDCYQVKDIDDAVKEMWRRKDKDDEILIASLRASAGLPVHEDNFSISLCSEDEENGPAKSKSEIGRSLKFSLKGLIDMSAKKDTGKKFSKQKHSRKKGYQRHLDRKVESGQDFEYQDVKATGYNLLDSNANEVQSPDTDTVDVFSSPVAGICSTNHPLVLKHRLVDEVIMTSENVAPHVPHGVNIGEVSGKRDSKTKAVKGPKLVIHLGMRNKNMTSSPRSDVPNYHEEHDLTTSNRNEETGQPKMITYTVGRHDSASRHGKIEGAKLVYSRQSKGSKHRRKDENLMSPGKLTLEMSNASPSCSGNDNAGGESLLLNARAVLKERRAEGQVADVDPAELVSAFKDDKMPSSKLFDGHDDSSGGSHANSRTAPVQVPQKDSRPLLRLKFKNPIIENPCARIAHGNEDKSSVKGQRSKRKRPSGNTISKDEGPSILEQDNPMGEIMEADWILKKLGKDAIGKRVEVEQTSDNTWHKGVVADVIKGSSTVCVDLDDGRSKTLELGKQGIRFVPLKKKRSRT